VLDQPAPVRAAVQVRRLDAGDDKVVARETSYVSPTRLRVTLRPEDVGSEGALEVAVANPEPGGGVSQALTVTIATPAGLPLEE
jgi:hypothetical protein